MALPRFFCPLALTPQQTVDLPTTVARHAGRALRLAEGDPIILFNGDGGEYQAILRFQQGLAQAEILSFSADNRMPAGEIILIQALASGDKMDWIIEKAVEIGVQRFIPIQAERSVLQLQGPRLIKRLQHWQGIIQSACEQSGRNRLMHLDPPQTLKSILATPLAMPLLLANPDSALSLRDYLLEPRILTRLCLLIGPEGGWSDKESQAIVNQGGIGLRFGERVLRTETAGLALSSATIALLGW